MAEALTDIVNFLIKVAPFDQLPKQILAEQVVPQITIGYQVAKQALPLEGAPKNVLYIVRKGALGYFDNQQNLLGKFGESDICTVFYHLTEQAIEVICQEDCLLYQLDGDWFYQFSQQHQAIKQYFSLSAEQKLQSDIAEQTKQHQQQNILLTKTLAELCQQKVITIDANASIAQAAQLMTEHHVSCLPVTLHQQLCGIVTDKDMRSRCIAKGVSSQRPVTDIMSNKVISLQHDETAHDALLLMMQQHIHHVPVLNHDKLFGVISATDLINQQAETAASLISFIRKITNIDDIKQFAQLLRSWQLRILTNGISAEHFGQNMAAIHKALTAKLIKRVMADLGEAPVSFAWLAAGSQARAESLLNADQDNALILSDQVQTEHLPYFEQLAQQVCDYLNLAGFCYCPGYIMASNDKWRQSKAVWRNYFEQWIAKPDAQALLNASVFFDLETAYGDHQLLDDVRQYMLSLTQKNSLFIAHLSQNANRQKPPLGFFRDFVLISSGEHKAMLDIKKVGTSVIVDLARIYALALGLPQVSTLERLRAAAGSNQLSQSAAKSLIDGFKLVTQLRLNHQFQQLKADKNIDNFISPTKLSRVEREHLKAVFKAIKLMQDARPAVYS